MKSCCFFVLVVLVGVAFSATIQRIPQPINKRVAKQMVRDVLNDLDMDKTGDLNPEVTTPKPVYSCKREYNSYHCQGCFYDYVQHQCCCPVYK
uniref:Hepcidin n=1 Tax=Magallana gigas TaxID=29159 RepID=A0A8W8HKT8_MAGGI